MTITSKIQSRCKVCHGPIVPGDRIIWARGISGATHVDPRTCAAFRQSAPAVAPATSAPKTVSAAPIVAFLQNAAQKIKYPKARFLAPGSTTSELRLSLAGFGSKYPGAIQVKIDNQWLGRVNADGSVAGQLRYRTDVVTTLAAIASDPLKHAAAYGALMSRCSFCSKKLTDAGSVKMGYGPICAANWSMPHTALGTTKLTAHVPSVPFLPVPKANIAPQFLQKPVAPVAPVVPTTPAKHAVSVEFATASEADLFMEQYKLFVKTQARFKTIR